MGKSAPTLLQALHSAHVAASEPVIAPGARIFYSREVFMRPVWKGSIAFGLVNIPVRLYSATDSQSLASHMLYKKDLSRIRFQRVSESTGKEVSAEEIVRGYEVDKDQYVIISDDDLSNVSPEKSSSIEIQEFVIETDISSLYFEKPYYLEPDKGAAKAYALLREALARSGKVGIAQFVLRNRESLCVLKPQGQGLVLNALRFAAEIRSMDELSLPTNEKLSAGEVSLATKLIEGMTGKFDPSKYKDTYTEEVRKLIEAKAKGEKRQAAAPKPAKSNVIDLVAALQESLGTVKKGRKRTAA
jgi:DNA end-binding protein Ku